MNREITLAKHEGFDDAVAANTNHVHAAIGYLATWGLASERFSGKMTLYGDKDGNWHATYRDKQDNVTYNIFGQRNEDGTYGFHS